MSEAISRPAQTRGRGAGRGGRGGARGNTRGRTNVNGSHKDTSFDDVDDEEDQGGLGEMKKQYSSQLPMLKELFEDWNEVDLLFALQEQDGDLESTIDRISEGHVSKFSDVKSTKEKSKPKPRDAPVQGADASANTRSVRGRGGFDSARGGRGRPDRGRGGLRGGRGVTHPATNGTRAAVPATSIPTAEGAWDIQPATDSAVPEAAPKAAAPVPAQETTKVSVPTESAGGKKTWAQMFAKPVPVPVQPKPVAEPAPVLEAPSEASSGFVEVTHADAEPEEERPTSVPVEEVPISEPPEVAEPEAPTVELTPSKDQLTEENVEHLPNDAQPPPTGTAASEVESSRGPDSAAPSTIGQTQAPIARPALGGKLDGFQTSAYKATGVTGAARSASFNRRILEQQEAVVMPGNHAVDRTAVQFGSLGLSGEALDVDEDREEAETRTQPPQHSPVAQPRASLPPVARQQPAPAEAPVPEATPAIKAAPGLPPAPQQQQPFAHQSPNTIASQTQQASHAGQGYNQFGRYNQAGLPSDTSAQKQYDPFGQQVPSAFEQYPSSTQAPSQTQSQLGGFSSAATDYSSYYTADQRNAYQNYYNSYGQQGAGSQQDAGAAQQRTGSGFGAAGDSAFPASQSQQQQNQARYGDAQQSGHNTPNPTAVGAQQAAGAQSQHAHQQQPHGQAQHQGYPGAYSQHAYYNSPYWSAYQQQYSPYGQQAGFGGPFGGKGGMYNQPHHGYGQNAYDQHSSSPANAAGFGGRETSLGSGLGAEYGRSGSTQPSQTQSASAGAFGSDPFSRSQSGFPGQNQGYGQQQSAQQGAAEDSLKPFSDGKSGAGPSPSSIGQPGRPGSATNTAAQVAQTGLPPPQSHQQGFGAYPGHPQQQMGQTSQYGSGLGGLGGHTAGAQTHQAAGQYGNYGAGFGNNNSYGSYGGRGGGGWGGNYGH
ncbi:hypothetical protein BLS_000209 [Venturia inaequalis]|uniref:RNA polymerase II degradation factor 1 n=1 Tax=Venturia inaequalis TaxID=5025 RepID=A0A8H3U350_VENIN|nr:hypothetical protein BLS_000209 [Venturia inaequalis]